jgi:hypothetical protein
LQILNKPGSILGEQVFIILALQIIYFTSSKGVNMARVFTINFSYKGELRSALVSFQAETYDMSFLVRYLDEDLGQLIPGRRIVVSLAEGIKSPKQLNKLAEDLVCQTAEAISGHLHFEHS